MTAERPEDFMPPASEAHGAPDRVPAMLRASEVARLRAMGHTWQHIADQLGWADHSGPRKLLEEYAKRQLATNVEAMREVWNETHRLQLATMIVVLRDPKSSPMEKARASAEITRLGARSARLNGLDAPVQIEVSGEARARVEQALALLEDTVLGQVTAVSDEPIPDEQEEPREA